MTTITAPPRLERDILQDAPTPWRPIVTDWDRPRPWLDFINEYERNSRAAVIDRVKATTLGDCARFTFRQLVKGLVRYARALTVGAQAFRSELK